MAKLEFHRDEYDKENDTVVSLDIQDTVFITLRYVRSVLRISGLY